MTIKQKLHKEIRSKQRLPPCSNCDTSVWTRVKFHDHCYQCIYFMNLVGAGPIIITFHNDLHHHTKRNSTFCTCVFLCSIWFSEQELCPYTALIHWFYMTKTTWVYQTVWKSLNTILGNFSLERVQQMDWYKHISAQQLINIKAVFFSALSPLKPYFCDLNQHVQ
jgi:hypothetical protein